MKLSKKKIIWFIVFALVAILVWLYPIVIPCSNKYKQPDYFGPNPFPPSKSISVKIQETLQEWLPPIFCVGQQ